MSEKVVPASDEEIAHGRISLDEMYSCVNCPTERGGRCFRCSIHPAILARIDRDRALLAEKDHEIAGLASAHDNAQEGLRNARMQEGQMRALLDEAREMLKRVVRPLSHVPECSPSHCVCWIGGYRALLTKLEGSR